MAEDEDDNLWTVKLRVDQMDCVIECLSWLVKKHDARIKHNDVAGIDEFAHHQAKSRIEDTLVMFTEIGHRSSVATAGSSLT